MIVKVCMCAFFMQFAAATAGCAANPGKEGVTAAPAKV